MLRKLRTFLAALLLVPVLIANANAFTTEADGAGLNPSKPKSAWCWVNAGGYWYVVPC